MKRLVLQEAADDLLSAWCDARGDDLLPNARFIDPVKLRRWVGDLSVIQVHEGEKRFFVSLHGANVGRHLGPDFHRKYLEDAVPETHWGAAFAPYELSIRTNQPSYSIQRATAFNGLFKCLERMVMPLWVDDPQKTARFLVWVAPIEPSSAVGTSSIYLPFDDTEIGASEMCPPETSAELFLLSDRYLATSQAA